jgi:rare lipoprotein A
VTTWRANIPICLASWSITMHASMALAHERCLASISDAISPEDFCEREGNLSARKEWARGPAARPQKLDTSPLPQLSPCLWGKCKGAAVGSMRPSFCIFGLALAWLITSSGQAHSQGFAWFFAHSGPHGTCSGKHVVATFYGSGRRTASGQTFDPSGYTAAHRTLPFGSRITVTNPRNGKSVTVVINDRGPFTRGITLDLARGAARAIGMYRTEWVCML